MRDLWVHGLLASLVLASCAGDDQPPDGEQKSEAERMFQEAGQDRFTLLQESCQCSRANPSSFCTQLESLDLTMCQREAINENQYDAWFYAQCVQKALHGLDDCLSLCRLVEEDTSDKARDCQSAFFAQEIHCVDRVSSFARKVEGCTQSPEPSHVLCGDGLCDAGERCAQDCRVDPNHMYLFLLVEDTAETVAGAYPGADLDAIALLKADESVFYASAVEDYRFVHGDIAILPEAVLGPPDDSCVADPTTFVSLGGVGGYVVVSFTTNDFEGRIENGDELLIHEVGRTSCPMQSYNDDPYRATISISVMDAISGHFVVLGEASGESAIPVGF